MAWKCFYPQEVGKYHIKESCVLLVHFQKGVTNLITIIH